MTFSVDTGGNQVPYTAEISRANPTCFLFLIDQSGSMSDSFGGEPGTKADGVADAMNKLLQALVFRCAKGETVLDRYHIGVIGYGSGVGPALGGSLAGRAVVPVSEIANNPLRVEERTKKVSDGAGGLVEQQVKFPVWFERKAAGGTPMCQALEIARQTVTDFVGQHPACFPPIVINITDGEASDGQPHQVEQAASAVRDISSEDGNVVLFNMHVSSKSERPIEFPADEQGLPDDYARMLFRMSSVLPLQMQEAARREGFKASEGSRGFVFNANLISVVQFLDIGTRVDRSMR